MSFILPVVHDNKYISKYIQVTSPVFAYEFRLWRQFFHYHCYLIPNPAFFEICDDTWSVVWFDFMHTEIISTIRMLAEDMIWHISNIMPKSFNVAGSIFRTVLNCTSNALRDARNTAGHMISKLLWTFDLDKRWNITAQTLGYFNITGGSKIFKLYTIKVNCLLK